MEESLVVEGKPNPYFEPEFDSEEFTQSDENEAKRQWDITLKRAKKIKEYQGIIDVRVVPIYSSEERQNYYKAFAEAIEKAGDLETLKVIEDCLSDHPTDYKAQLVKAHPAFEALPNHKRDIIAREVTSEYDSQVEDQIKYFARILLNTLGARYDKILQERQQDVEEGHRKKILPLSGRASTASWAWVIWEIKELLEDQRIRAVLQRTVAERPWLTIGEK